jgi:anthranilate phosphoribosyltransferase
MFCYRDGGAEYPVELEPAALEIRQATRAVPLPQDLVPVPAGNDGETAPTLDSDAAAAAAAAAGLEALHGRPGAARDSLVYGAAIMLHHLGRADSLKGAAAMAARALDSGSALARFHAARG